MKLTERQKEILNKLSFQLEEWRTPMHIGAWDSSYHSAVLNQLVRKGLVERRVRGLPGRFKMGRSGCEYRLKAKQRG